jgi:hypothetical protein
LIAGVDLLCIITQPAVFIDETEWTDDPAAAV